MNEGPELHCELCQKPSAELRNFAFDVGEYFEICPTCQKLLEAVDVLSTNASALFQAIEKQSGEACAPFFIKRLAAAVGYEMAE